LVKLNNAYVLLIAILCTQCILHRVNSYIYGKIKGGNAHFLQQFVEYDLTGIQGYIFINK